MADPLIVRLLGEPRFCVAATPVACTSKKAVGLFAYLSLSGRMHGRRELAALFWGLEDEEASRANLRAALHRFPAPLAACLAIDRESVGVVPAMQTLDVARFERLAREEGLERLEDAVDLYRGDFLAAFEAGATAEYDDWLHRERMRLRQIAQSIFDRIVTRRAERAALDAARATVERESALATARRWVALMPGVETAHRWLMQLYIDTGQRDAALAQYELCQRELAVTHGRAPSPATRALHASALAASSGPAVVGAKPAAAATLSADALEHVGIAATRFVGRVDELAELDRLLAEPHCRLVTLHGLGGAGKTRLAHALASQVAARFAHGASWIALETVHSADEFVTAIAASLRRDLPPRGDRVARLAEMLQSQQRLLILDNFETLLAAEAIAPNDSASALLRILQSAPRVRAIVTSREVLNLQEEWVYEVRGLAFDSHDTAMRAPTAAVELFMQRARQAHLAFSPSSEMPHVVRICKLVEGLPLGIELAAAWVRTIPCAEIAAAIEREAAALSSVHRNRPERHRSLEAVVAYSWNLLSGEQQAALAALGNFVGGFSADAAEQVGQVSLRTLSGLVDKALVRRHGERRYGLHELVRQFALARLRGMPMLHDSVRERYRRHFAQFVTATVEQMHGPGEAAAAAAIAPDLANVLSAWRESIESHSHDGVRQMAASLVALLHSYGTLPAALAEARRAVEVLGMEAPDDIVALVRMQWGRAAITGGEPDIAARELSMALVLARRVGTPETIIRCHYFLGSLDYQQGNLDAADAAGREALALITADGDPELRCLVHNLLGVISGVQSRFEAAETHLRAGLAAAREQQAPSRIAMMLCSLAVPLYYRGDYAEAASLTTEAAALYRILGRHVVFAMVVSNLAAMALAQSDLAGAHAHAQDAVRLTRESGDANLLSGALATQSDVLLQQGQSALARAAAEESLRLAEAVRQPLHVTEALFLLTSIELAEGHPDRALAHVLRLRDALAAHSIAVRVPMLILATAEWALSSPADTFRNEARRWVEGLCAADDIDASLRDKGRRLLQRTRRPPEPPAIGTGPGGVSLASIHAEVAAFLPHIAPQAGA
jgi:predicted ATPase/DNA-binding SARP family transcriptional activator